MSTENLSSTSATPAPAATTTTPAAPAANAAPSLINPAPTEGTPAPAAEAWAEYVPDAAKSAEENAALKTAHDATKPAEAAKPVAVVPVAATDIKLPEGFQVDEPVMNEFLGLINDDKLTPAERSQKLIDLQIKSTEAAREAASSAWETMMGDWQKEVSADSVVGGAKFDQSVATANKVINSFGSPELATLAATTGIGNNVHFIRFLNAIAPKLLEGAPLKAGGPAGGITQSPADRIYDRK